MLEKARIPKELKKQIEIFTQEESIRSLCYRLTEVCAQCKEEFFQKLKKMIISYDIQSNSVVGENAYRILRSRNVNEYFGIGKSYDVTLFKRYSILIFKIKVSSIKKKVYLFSILPVWKERTKAEVCTYYLLAFVPVFKKKLKSIELVESFKKDIEKKGKKKKIQKQRKTLWIKVCLIVGIYNFELGFEKRFNIQGDVMVFSCVFVVPIHYETFLYGSHI